MSRKERIIVILLASINFTHILDFMIMMPLGNYLIPFFNISPMQFSFLVGAYTLSAATSGFLAAFFVDQVDRKKVLILGYSGFLIGTIACGFAPTYGLLLMSRIFAGVFGGLISAQVMSIISDLFTYERRGFAMGSVMSAFAIASTIGVPFSLYLSNLFTWHAPFLLVGGLGIVVIPLVMKYIPKMAGHLRKKEEGDHPLRVLMNVLESRQQVLTLLFSLLLMMGHFLIIPFINPYMEFNKGYTKDQTPMIYLFGGMASFISALALGRFADRVGKLKVFFYSVLFSTGMVWLITNMPTIPFSIVLVFFAIWFTLATGRAVTAQAMISNVVLPEQRGSFMSFNSSVQQLGSAFASFVAGFLVIKDSSGKLRNYEWVGYTSILVLLTTLVLGQYLFRGLDRKTGKKPAGQQVNQGVSLKEVKNLVS